MLPFAVKNSRAFGPEALALLSDTSWLIRAETGEPKSYQFLLWGIAVTVQRENAVAILGAAQVVGSVSI